MPQPAKVPPEPSLGLRNSAQPHPCSVHHVTAAAVLPLGPGGELGSRRGGHTTAEAQALAGWSQEMAAPGSKMCVPGRSPPDPRCLLPFLDEEGSYSAVPSWGCIPCPHHTPGESWSKPLMPKPLTALQSSLKFLQTLLSLADVPRVPSPDAPQVSAPGGGNLTFSPIASPPGTLGEACLPCHRNLPWQARTFVFITYINSESGSGVGLLGLCAMIGVFAWAHQVLLCNAFMWGFNGPLCLLCNSKAPFALTKWNISKGQPDLIPFL